MANDSTSYPQADDHTASARAQREEYWRRVLARQRESGLGRGDFCRRDGIKNSALSWWTRKLRERDQAKLKPEARRPRRRLRRPAFVPVRIIEAAPPMNLPAVEVVTRGGHVIRLQPGFDPTTLRRAVAALEGQPC